MRLPSPAHAPLLLAASKPRHKPCRCLEARAPAARLALSLLCWANRMVLSRCLPPRCPHHTAIFRCWAWVWPGPVQGGGVAQHAPSCQAPPTAACAKPLSTAARALQIHGPVGGRPAAGGGQMHLCRRRAVRRRVAGRHEVRAALPPAHADGRAACSCLAVYAVHAGCQGCADASSFTERSQRARPACQPRPSRPAPSPLLLARLFPFPLLAGIFTVCLIATELGTQLVQAKPCMQARPRQAQGGQLSV